jgi:hypothetical protein
MPVIGGEKVRETKPKAEAGAGAAGGDERELPRRRRIRRVRPVVCRAM